MTKTSENLQRKQLKVQKLNSYKSICKKDYSCKSHFSNHSTDSDCTNHKEQHTEHTCAICLDDIDQKQIATVGLCIHKFCFECIKKWAHTSSNTCPVCKIKFNQIIKGSLIINVIDTDKRYKNALSVHSRFSRQNNPNSQQRIQSRPRQPRFISRVLSQMNQMESQPRVRTPERQIQQINQRELDHLESQANIEEEILQNNQILQPELFLQNQSNSSSLMELALQEPVIETPRLIFQSQDFQQRAWQIQDDSQSPLSNNPDFWKSYFERNFPEQISRISSM